MARVKKPPNDFRAHIGAIKKAKSDDEVKDYVSKSTKILVSAYKASSTYKKIAYLYDPQKEINRFAPDEIYKYVSVGVKSNLLMVLVSPGGSVESAYVTSKICKEFSKKFVVVVPRLAKSAATLLALGADEIHMGTVSELGPIDPQIGGLPALGMESALEMIAEVTSKYPGSAETFAKYLSLSLGLRTLGYSRRIADSAVDYAVRLLDDKQLGENFTAQLVAKKLVYDYKDHGFVIDKSEAKSFLGNIIKTDTAEYKFGDEIYRFFEDIQLLVNIFRKQYFSVIGGIDEGVVLSDIPDNK